VPCDEGEYGGFTAVADTTAMLTVWEPSMSALDLTAMAVAATVQPMAHAEVDLCVVEPDAPVADTGCLLNAGTAPVLVKGSWDADARRPTGVPLQRAGLVKSRSVRSRTLSAPPTRNQRQA
jgi:hypothetical protein